FRSKYPPIEANETGFMKPLDSDIHTIYWEESGNPQGKPVVVLHGGPGGGCPPSYRQYFDAQRYRIIMFDQRGAGKSTPLAELRENTTWHLIRDMEQLREQLNVEKWVVFGGSWGSTLSLAYAETHPDHVTALVLRGIFLCRCEGTSWIFPYAHEKFAQHIPAVERGDLVSAYHRRVTCDDPETRLAASMEWTGWEMWVSNLIVDEKKVEEGEDPDFAESFARIETHYFTHCGFFHKENQLIEDVDKIRDIPATIVQGRYDVVCPIKSCWELHTACAQPALSRFRTADSGHSMSEAGITSELIKAEPPSFPPLCSRATAQCSRGASALELTGDRHVLRTLIQHLEDL
ncbi:hypothetical protein EMIHUDRAFT_76054, partial [Emiliania huxleyi CCMP1516]|uniref:Proline iminopeptidase n=2 Tax=Emiliania huxleyi TaxID=2903 RepID=A0A0D3IYX8_EMIH1